jgi:glutamine transport system substrate-binding protein
MKGGAMKKIVRLLITVTLILTCGTGLAFGKNLVVATDTNFKPFSYKDKTGTYVGFDVEFWDAIAKELNLEYDLQPMDFNGIIPGLQTGNIDVAVAGMSIKSKREEVIDFAYPYYKAGLVIMVRADNTDIQTMEDFKGKIVATKLATSSVDFLKEKAQFKELKQFPNITDAFMELMTGGTDVVFFDLPPLADYANTVGKGRVKIVGPLYMGHHYGIGFPQGSALRDKVSIAILRLMENGTYAKIYKKWFGAEPK